MEGPRAPLLGEYKNLIHFLNNSLRENITWSIENEYPTAVNPKNLHNIRIITENNQILSHACLRPLLIRTPYLVYKAGAIGSVVTDTNYRNQGLSHQIITSCLDEATKQDCDFAILWSNLYDYYRKFGFELGGHEISAIYNKKIAVKPLSTLQFLCTPKVDPQAILKVYQKHTTQTYRTTEDIRKYLDIPNTRVYTAWDQRGEMVAFAIEGKGADLTGYIHEWGGAVPHLLSLFNHILEQRGQEFTVITPITAQSLIQVFKQENLMTHFGYLGMIKILKPDQLFKKINKMAQQSNLPQFELSTCEQGFRMKWSGGDVIIAEEKDLVQLLFGPEMPTELLGDRSEDLQRLNDILPLPLWIWGWDSI